MTERDFETIMRRQINSVLRLACSYLKCPADPEQIASLTIGGCTMYPEK